MRNEELWGAFRVSNCHPERAVRRSRRIRVPSYFVPRPVLCTVILSDRSKAEGAEGSASSYSHHVSNPEPHPSNFVGTGVLDGPFHRRTVLSHVILSARSAAEGSASPRISPRVPYFVLSS